LRTHSSSHSNYEKARSSKLAQMGQQRAAAPRRKGIRATLTADRASTEAQAQRQNPVGYNLQHCRSRTQLSSWIQKTTDQQDCFKFHCTLHSSSILELDTQGFRYTQHVLVTPATQIQQDDLFLWPAFTQLQRVIHCM